MSEILPEIEVSQPNFNVGRVISNSFKVFHQNIITFGIICLLFHLPETVLYVLENIYDKTFSYAIFSVFISCIMTGVITYGTYEYIRGHQLTFSELISIKKERWVPVLKITFGFGLFIIIPIIFIAILGGGSEFFNDENLVYIIGGAAILILIIVMCLFVIYPIAVIEDLKFMDIFKRSLYLSSGHRIKILGLLVFLIFFLIAPISIITYVLGGNEIFLAFVTWPIEAYITGYWIILTCLTYVELCAVKDGKNPSEITEVFD